MILISHPTDFLSRGVRKNTAIAILVMRVQRKADTERFGRTEIQVSAKFAHRITTAADTETATRRSAGISRGDVDRATHGVLAEQGALRTAQHFYTRNIGQINGATRRAGDIHTVHIHRYTWIGINGR